MTFRIVDLTDQLILNVRVDRLGRNIILRALRRALGWVVAVKVP